MTHSFPTRRSSDLERATWRQPSACNLSRMVGACCSPARPSWSRSFSSRAANWRSNPPSPSSTNTTCRSEEHTSELQSLMRISYAVFCLKKKTQINTTPIYTEQYEPQRHTFNRHHRTNALLH